METKEAAIAVIMLAAAVGPAMAIGWIASSATSAIGRNPEAASKVQAAMILGLAFAEAIAIYALVVSLVLKFA